MARIDLGRYDVGISKSVQVADVASDPNAGAYRALQQLGGDVATFANNTYQKEMDIKRKAEAWRAYEEYTKGVGRAKLEGQSRWDKMGNVDGMSYDAYISQHSEKTAQDVANTIQDPDAREMFIRQVRPDDLRTKVDGFVDMQKRRLTAVPEYYSGKAKDIASKTIDINSEESTEFLVTEMDNTLKESDDVIGTIDLDMKEKTRQAILQTGGEALASKYTNLHLSGGVSTAKVLSEFTGVNILFDSKQRKYVVDFLKSTDSASTKEREDIINGYLQAVAPKLQKLVDAQVIKTETDPKNISGVQPAIGPNGEMTLDVIDLEGQIVEKVKLQDIKDPSFGRVETASTKYFNSLSADKKIAFYKDILSAKFAQNDTAKKEYRQQLENIIAAPGIDWNGRKGSNLNMAYIKGRYKELVNSPLREEAGVTNTELVTMTSNLTANAIMERISDDLIAGGPFIEASDEQIKKEMYNIAGEVFSKDDPVWQEFARPEAAGKMFAELNQNVKKQQRQMRAEWSSSPSKFVAKYGNQRYQRIFDKGIDVDGNINLKVLAQQKGIIDRLTKNFGVAGSKDDSIIFQTALNNANLALERAKAAGPQEVSRVLNNFANMPAEIRGRFVKELVKGKVIAEDGEASTITYGMLGGGPKNPLEAKLTMELQDLNTKESRKQGEENFKSVFGEQATALTKSIDARFNEMVQEKLPALHGDLTREAQPILRALKEPIMSAVMQKAKLGMDESDLEKLVDQEMEKHITSRVSSVNESSIRGVFPKLADEDAIVSQAEEKVESIREQIKSGKIKIDYSQYPELNATLIGRKSGTSSLMQPNTKEEQFLKTYEIGFDGVDPFGGSGKVRLMLRGKGGKTAPLKILKDNRSVDYPVEWMVK